MDVLAIIECIEKTLDLGHHGKTVNAIDTTMTNLSTKNDELVRRLDIQSATITELT